MNRPRTSGLVQSIHDRLKNAAQERGRPFAELLELYAVERFLHRLGCSPHRERFVLKGALLLRHWLGSDTRPTRDIDLLAPVDLDPGGLREVLGELLRVEVEVDGIEFDLNSIFVRPIRAESTVLGLRAKFDAHLGRTRLRYQVDAELGDSVFPPTVDVIAGGLLGLPMASVRAYTPYTAVAEKLEAMVVLGDANSRTKDYYDLLELPCALAFDGRTLAESVRRTFARRATRIPSDPLAGLCDRFASEVLHATRWRAFLTKNLLETIEVDFRRVAASIRRFAQPVLDAVREEQSFDRRWPPGGPWR